MTTLSQNDSIGTPSGTLANNPAVDDVDDSESTLAVANVSLPLTSLSSDCVDDATMSATRDDLEGVDEANTHDDDDDVTGAEQRSNSIAGYDAIIQYLKTKSYPPNYTKKDKTKLRVKCQRYVLIGDHLFYRPSDSSDPRREVMPADRLEIIRAVHDDPMSGAHSGINKTFDRLSARYHWKGMYDDVRRYVQQCEICQHQRANTQEGMRHNSKCQLPVKFERAFARIGVDVLGPFPPSARNNRYIFMATDQLTKWAEATAVPEMTPERMARFIFEEIVCRHGCTELILLPEEFYHGVHDHGGGSQNGGGFGQRALQALREILGPSASVHAAEHSDIFNVVLHNLLSKLVVDSPNDWDASLAWTLFNYRVSRHAATNEEPFFLLYGRRATFPSTSATPIGEELPSQQLMLTPEEGPHVSAQPPLLPTTALPSASANVSDPLQQIYAMQLVRTLEHVQLVARANEVRSRKRQKIEGQLQQGWADRIINEVEGAEHSNVLVREHRKGDGVESVSAL
ncbi:uncharacterized protein VTP21DRAFT_10678 [Calcarisporiella thermophila]|uniref:uncharacterized protein n=1 Tax=Calcarisporiella thermophila TaxID=911321 RepID=UPI003743BF2C